MQSPTEACPCQLYGIEKQRTLCKLWMMKKNREKGAEFNLFGHCTKIHQSGKSLFLPWGKGRSGVQGVEKLGLLLWRSRYTTMEEWGVNVSSQYLTREWMDGDSNKRCPLPKETFTLKYGEENICIQMVRFLNHFSYERILIPPAMEEP